MNIGRLDRVAKLLSKQVVRGSGGEAKDVWVEIETLYVSKPRLTSGSLLEIAEKTGTRGNYTFESRFRLSVKPYCRMFIEGVSYDIITAIEKGSRRECLVITANVTT